MRIINKEHKNAVLNCISAVYLEALCRCNILSHFVNVKGKVRLQPFGNIY